MYEVAAVHGAGKGRLCGRAGDYSHDHHFGQEEVNAVGVARSSGGG